MLEFEKKIILSPQEYDFLVRLQDQSAEKIEQINHYYDTDDFALNRKGITYRIREINDEFTATIKNHRAAAHDAGIELSQPAFGKYDTSLFGSSNVELQGSLSTVRLKLVSDKNLNVSLDQNTYLGIKDYELEIEYDPDAHYDAERFAQSLAELLYFSNCQTDISEFCNRANFSKSKSERFFERLAMTQHLGDTIL